MLKIIRREILQKIHFVKNVEKENTERKTAVFTQKMYWPIRIVTPVAVRFTYIIK